jgi:molecular chaperone GrpE
MYRMGIVPGVLLWNVPLIKGLKLMNDELKKENIEDQVEEAVEEGNGASETELVIEESCEELLDKKDQEIKQLQDRLLRLAAESENSRKRLEREKADGIAYANEVLLRALLPIGDTLELAIRHGESDTDPQVLLEGIKMTQKVFMDVLAKHGCVPFDSEGKLFDPNFHEAMMQQESDEHPEKTILQEFQKGYMLNERLLRPAMVVVSKGMKGG